AVRCAMDLQTKLHEHNLAAPERERLQIRIGIHLGDVVRQEGDLFGDTVNIAARVEPEAAPGGIALSQTVYEQIRGKFDHPLLSMGGRKLKGITEEVALYAVKLPWQDAVSAGPRPGLLARLKQHHMFRIASWYATAAYVLILAANAVFPDIGFTREDVRYLIAALALGFPVALTLFWMFVPPSKDDPAMFGRWRHLRWRLGSVVAIVVIAFVAASGAYLWHLDEYHVAADGSPSVAVLPFDRLGAVDPALTDGMQGTIETTLAGIGSVHVISHRAITAGSAASALELARKAGADYVVQGSIQRADTGAPYSIRAEVLAVRDSTPEFSVTDSYAAAARPVAIQQQVASAVAGPVRFLSRPDDWLAPGHATTRDPRAMRLLRQALMAYYYFGDASQVTLLREATDLDPDFAQAHAYLACFILFDDPSDAAKQAAGDEIARAAKLDPDLPEIHLARGILAWFKPDDAAVQREFAATEAALPKNFLLHFSYGRELAFQERDQEALKEMDTAAAIDPFQHNTPEYAARLDYFMRDYEHADEVLADAEQRWPLYAQHRLYRAQTAFAYHGDVAALAKVIDGDWSAYRIEGDWLPARRIEVAHLEGRHEDALKQLAAYPHAALEPTRFWDILGRNLYRDSFSVETLRLLGREREAAQAAALAIPVLTAASDLRQPDEILHLAELQAFGGDAAQALKTIQPLIERYRLPQAQWGLGDGRRLAETAVVLAWSGKTQDAIELLRKSLAVADGAHAAVLAKDPVWQPLYREPAFKALLAAHGQVLAFAR
ncbi:MAG TPA: adenylate/guanylate cyclase domain-containing protein, partial [Gammaproteobacteria bacterium]